MKISCSIIGALESKKALHGKRPYFLYKVLFLEFSSHYKCVAGGLKKKIWWENYS